MTKTDKEILENKMLHEYSSRYSSLPDFIPLDRKGKILYIRKKIIEEWFNTHKGKQNAVPLNKIAKELHFDNFGNSVNFRSIVASLVIDDLFPIVSCPKGYYKAHLENEVLENIQTEEKRVMGIKKRINALYKILEKRKQR